MGRRTRPCPSHSFHTRAHLTDSSFSVCLYSFCCATLVPFQLVLYSLILTLCWRSATHMLPLSSPIRPHVTHLSASTFECLSMKHHSSLIRLLAPTPQDCPPCHQSCATVQGLSHCLPQHRLQMQHSLLICNIQRPKSKLSTTQFAPHSICSSCPAHKVTADCLALDPQQLAVYQRQVQLQAFTPATPTLRSLRKPFNSNSIPSMTF